MKGPVYHKMRHSASEKRPEGLSLARGWRREAYGDRGSASCGECRKVVEVWCVKSGKWRTAGNIISCVWAQVTTRAAAGRTHNSMGAVRLRADSSGGFCGIGAASGRTGRRLALLIGGQSAAESAAPPPPLPPSGNEYAATGRLTAAGPSVRRAAAGPPPGQLPRRACRSRARGSG